MKRTYPVILIGVSLLVATGVALMASSRSAEAAKARFARPNYESAREGAVLDLTRYGALGDLKRREQLATDVQACHDALAGAGVDYTLLPAISSTGGCGYKEAVVVQSSLAKWSAPEVLPLSCDLAARLHMWERHIVIPAAEKWLGSPVVGIEAFGSFQCRRVAGENRLSEHAFAKAADIAAFRLADGRRVSVLKHYGSKGAEGDFLREIHDRACGLFDVTLGPDYNADHANHLHLDVGGERACR
jgi:hypothetical protein